MKKDLKFYVKEIQDKIKGGRTIASIYGEYSKLISAPRDLAYWLYSFPRPYVFQKYRHLNLFNSILTLISIFLIWFIPLDVQPSLIFSIERAVLCLFLLYFFKFIRFGCFNGYVAYLILFFIVGIGFLLHEKLRVYSFYFIFPFLSNFILLFLLHRRKFKLLSRIS